METLKRPSTPERLACFVSIAADVNHSHLNSGDFTPCSVPVFSVDPNGKRYARIVSTGYGARSVHCFVDLINGDILKAASWRAPAKHARGNIWDNDGGRSALTPWGVRYLN